VERLCFRGKKSLTGNVEKWADQLANQGGNDQQGNPACNELCAEVVESRPLNIIPLLRFCKNSDNKCLKIKNIIISLGQ
jgi:hypothetical protein